MSELGSAMRGHRLFAATYDWLNQSSERGMLGTYRALIAGEATGRVLEIGAGTGANFRFYDPTRVDKVVATEPDPYMLKRAQKRAAGARLPVEVQQYAAERLPFPDASFDTLVATLVLCTVDDPARALAEMRRVLVGGGTLRLIEHVRAPDGFAAKVQDVLTPLWRRVGAGCCLNRRTASAIAAAGFEFLQIEEHRVPFSPIHTILVGVGRK